ncbi:MAG: desulfoferrodoxin family protein [Otoolea sp.]|nr:desulfoferrodoxin [Clostridiaceae bacterium]MDY5484314.1 desulfoferrodoxin family protein [Clostridium sp.]
MKFYICEHCGNIITFMKNAGVPVMCCGQKMTELVPGTSDGAVEKHVPAVSVEGQKVVVKVGEAEHPMLEAHYIQWIALETESGVQIKNLKPGEKPEAVFLLPEGEKAVAAYEYCNLHGLWKKEI